MRKGVADPSSNNYFNKEVFLNNLKLVSINTGTEKCLAIAVVDSDGNHSGGLSLPIFDYVSRGLAPDTTETYVFKTGGASGTTVATVVVVYTDNTLTDILTVTKT